MGFLSVEEALEATVIFPMKYYTQRHQDTISEYISNSPIYEIRLGAEGIPGSIRFLWW